MYLNKRLQTMMTEKKPDEEENFGRSNNMYGSSMNKANKDLMGGQSPGFKNKDEKLEYGLTKDEIKYMKIDLVEFDKQYEKF